MSLAQLTLLLVDSPLEFTPTHAEHALSLLLEEHTHHTVAAAFLTAFHIHNLAQNPHMLAACARALLNHAILIPCNEGSTSSLEDWVDVVGTGGDGHATFNVSTTAALVAAGAGIKVAKHGNRASTSKSGSADVLESLGCRLSLPASIHPILLNKANFTFLFAQHHHPHLKHLAQLRKQLPFRTVFNVLGPLVNPARPACMLVGVAEPSMGRVMLEALREMGVKRAWVVCGAEGLDEISPAGMTHVWAFDAPSSDVREFVIDVAKDFGPLIQSHPLSEVSGGDADDNAQLLRDLLDGKMQPGDAILDFVLMNAAALLVVSGKAKTLSQGVDLAWASVKEGKAKQELDQWKEETLRHHL